MEESKKQSNPVIVPSNAYVTVTKMNHIVEVQHMEKMNRTANIKKLSSDHYIDLSTGEKKEFTHSENRQQNYNSLRQTFKKIRYLINTNFMGKPNELHITLTYKENMTDANQLYKDYDKFFKRLRYKYRDVSSIDYISVIEPQERGAWHCHVLVRFNDLNTIFVPNEEVRNLWRNGFVTVKTLRNVDNIGAYLSAYLADIEVSDETDSKTALKAIEEGREVVTKEVEGKEKRFIKGGRLHMYPSGMNLYRKSKGIKMPKRQEMKFEKVKKIVGSAQPHYQKSFAIENNDFENTINYLQYNTKRY